SVRPPAVSGRFYPSDPTELRATVATLLADARQAVGPSGRPAVGLIAPHAGYIYSGPTAARAFVRTVIPALVIIVAPNHTGVCEAKSGVSLWEAGAFRTPLGEVPIAADVAEGLRKISGGVVEVDHAAHRSEHAVEVELPFLQLLRSDVRIVPPAIVLEATRALGATRADVVDYRHSGWVSGDNARVVGYAGVVIP